MNEIFKRNINCIWNEKLLTKEFVSTIENSSDEIIEGINFSFNDNKNFLDFKTQKFYEENQFSNFLGINRIPDINNYKKYLL